jgi:hypothetical protein
MPILTVTQIKDGFIHQHLDRIVGLPCYSTLKILKEQVCDNAGTVFSTGGDGTTGCLRAALTAAQFALVSNTPFDVPVHPGAPVFPDAQVAAQVREDIRTDHNVLLKHFVEFRTVDQILKAQIIAALEPQYVAALRLPTTNFITRTTLDFITHLMATYAVIGPRELQQNITDMQLPWNPPAPITTLYTQIENAVDLAQDSVPISEAAQINSAITNLTATGLFRQEITEWNRQQANAKTWPLFKTFFSRVEREQLQVNPLGAAAGGYAAHIEALTQDRDAAHAAAAENLAMAVRSYQENATINETLATLTAQLTALQLAVSTGHALARQCPRPRERGSRPSGDRPTPRTTAPPSISAGPTAPPATIPAATAPVLEQATSAAPPDPIPWAAPMPDMNWVQLILVVIF